MSLQNSDRKSDTKVAIAGFIRTLGKASQITFGGTLNRLALKITGKSGVDRGPGSAKRGRSRFFERKLKSMKMTDEKQALWNKGLENNQDGYGAAIYSYAERWANMIEERMAALSLDSPSPVEIGAVAKQASYDADTEGITGFMYGAAVSILSQCWEHGDALRRWHNIDTQIGNEGEIANEKGTTLNPAMLNIR